MLMSLRKVLRKTRVQRIDIEVSSSKDLGRMEARYVTAFISAVVAAYVATYLLPRVPFFGYSNIGIVLAVFLSILMYAAVLIAADLRAGEIYGLIYRLKNAAPLADLFEKARVVVNYESDVNAIRAPFIASLVVAAALAALAILEDRGPFVAERDAFYVLNMLECIVAVIMTILDDTIAFDITGEEAQQGQPITTISISIRKKRQDASR